MKKKTKCKRYAQAITDYVLGEEIDMPKEELMGHLKECAQCRQEATNWQDFQNALRVKEYHARPEVKEKWDRFISELTSPAPACVPTDVGTGRPIDAKGEITLAAGKIYDYLKRTGKVPRPVLREETGLRGEPFYETIGWLVMTEKVLLYEDKQTVYVALTESERQQAQV